MEQVEQTEKEVTSADYAYAAVSHLLREASEREVSRVAEIMMLRAELARRDAAEKTGG